MARGFVGLAPPQELKIYFSFWKLENKSGWGSGWVREGQEIRFRASTVLE